MESRQRTNEFHKIINQVLGGLQEVIAYFDNIVVYGKTMDQCRYRLIACMDRLKDNNIHLNKKKCQFFQERVKYLGHIIEDDLIKKLQDKIAAVVNAPQPKTPDDVRTFLGLITYYSKFIPNASSMTHPLKELLRQEC